MTSIFTMLPLMIVLAVIVGIGMLLTRWIHFQGDVKKALITILVFVAMPSIILQSIFSLSMTDELIRDIFMMLLFSVVINSAGIGLGWVVLRYSSFSVVKQKELAVLSGLGNAGFIGIPLCAVLFGAKGALLAAVFDAGQDLVIWTIVVMMLKQQSQFSWKGFKSLINPPVIAILLGLSAAILKLKPPEAFNQITEMLANLTVPLAMIYLGMLLVSLYEKSMFGYLKQVLRPLLSKLIILPLFVFACIALFMNSGLELELSMIQVIIIQSAMPTFTMASVIFAFCQSDEKLAAFTSVISTVISFVTIPFMLWLGQMILL